MKRNTAFLKTAIAFTIAFSIIMMIAGVALGSLYDSLYTGGKAGLVSGAFIGPLILLFMHRRKITRSRSDNG